MAAQGEADLGGVARERGRRCDEEREQQEERAAHGRGIVS
jgi:hypothetical protein